MSFSALSDSFRPRSLTALALGLVGTWLLSHSLRYAFSASRASVCNPYDQRGFFDWNPARAHEGRWVPLLSPTEKSCPQAPDWIGMLRLLSEDPSSHYSAATPEGRDEPLQRRQAREEAGRQLAFLRSKTIIVAGDSVDRNALDHLAYYAQSQFVPSSYHDAGIESETEGWDVRGVPHIVKMHKFDTQVSNLFFYGADDSDAFDHQNDWHAPGKAEHRLRELFVPFTKQLKYAPSFIQLHSGMWDLALFGREDTVSGTSTDLPLDAERIAWWFDRMRSIVAAFRDAYPDTPIWMRTLHRVGPLANFGSEDYTRGIEGQYKSQSFFSDIRCKQVREMQIALAKELCLPINDFGALWEGYAEHQNRVHPDPVPGGLVMLAPILHALWMESQGRATWVTKPCEVDWQVNRQYKYSGGRARHWWTA